MKVMLEAGNVKKVYGQKGHIYTALKDINLEIKEGEFVGIMGPSGSGKTTLLNILSTIDQATSGSIRIDGNDIGKMKEEQLTSFRREKLGFIFQDYNLLDTLTIEENIVLPLALSKVKAKEIDRRVKEIAGKFGIEDILSKFPYQVSGGQKQRAAASRAIIANPSLIFADEPTGALDSKSATALLQSLSQLNVKDHATIMMVTHDAFAASFCSRVLFIKDGVIFTELVKGETSRQEYFQKILDVLSALGGGKGDLI
ncbi:putative ABC transport system ATP-binding protein [Scopulibacillus daqui]|uniref:ABC transport system ATP-binding protein n=1 Tax=Scopulibacillus daqui TaxID=1469162 RepID=A0ABS2Q0Y9_9BACL|nr:ABC transporter ATP-binding protein [Scopulibacillus daqui]MBM7645954.1 putative ABC transport system ATP-binding protein [Scopulibacillus daqui]